jgi:nucleoside-diphosphate-sugar epimerase
MNVGDAVAAYKLCSTPEMVGKVVNFGSGKTITINDLATLIIKYTGSNLVPEHTNPRPGEVQRLQADITLAESLGFKPKTDFEKDLKSYVEWFRGNQ